jgi:2-aminoadipate transaminase
MDWGRTLARRARAEVSGELATILAGPPPGVLGMTGGFPNPATFQTDVLDEIAARLIRDEPAVALQYAPSEGLASVREFLLDRVQAVQGRRPEPEELTVTSGGMECIDLVSPRCSTPATAW